MHLVIMIWYQRSIHSFPISAGIILYLQLISSTYYGPQHPHLVYCYQSAQNATKKQEILTEDWV